MSPTIHVLYSKIFNIWRKKRFELFLRMVAPSASDILIDIGGYPESWVSHHQYVKRIDCLNLDVTKHGKYAINYNIWSIVGDGCSLSVANNSYNIGYSNSVIEHVGSWERQKMFASEIRRVAMDLWVQTPAYECPIEPHYLAPFIHYLPRSYQKKIIRWFTLRGWIERLSQTEIDKMVESTRLLRRSEMKQLFPDCEIITENILWIIPKSYIAIRKKAQYNVHLLYSNIKLT